MTLGGDSDIVTTSLIGLTRNLTNTQDNTAAFSAAQIKGYVNQAYQNITLLLLNKINTGWKINESIATGNLVDQQNSYTFTTSLSTTDVKTVDRVELNYDGTTNNYVVATPRKHHQFQKGLANTSSDEAVEGTKINPLWWPFGNDTLYIDPIPDANATNGIKVHLTNTVTDLSSSGDEPVLIEEAHQVLSFDAAIRWLNTKRRFDVASVLKGERDELMVSVLEHYEKRVTDKKPQIARRRNLFR